MRCGLGVVIFFGLSAGAMTLDLKRIGHRVRRQKPGVVT